MAWNGWFIGFENNDKNEGSHNFGGVSINSTSPIKGTYDGDFHYNRDGNNDILCAIQHQYLKDESGNGWRSAFGSVLFKMPSSVAGTAEQTIFHASTEDIGTEPKLIFKTGGTVLIKGSATSATFTNTLTGGTTYRFEFQIKAFGTGFFKVRMYDESDPTTLIEEEEISIGGGITNKWTWGMRNKNFTTTNPNAHAFMDNMFLWYSNDNDVPVWPGDQKIHYATVEAGTPTHNDFTGSPATGNNKYQNVDEQPHTDDTDFNRSVVTLGGGFKEQSHHAIAGPVLAGGDVINGVSLTGITRRSGNSRQGTFDLLIRDNSVDYWYDIDTLNATYGNNLRTFGLLKRPGGGGWTEATRDAIEVGSRAEISGNDSAWTPTGHVTSLPTGDSGSENDWTASSGGFKFVDVDEDSASPNNQNKITVTNNVGHQQGFTFGTPTLPEGMLVTGLAIAYSLGGNLSPGLKVQPYYKDSMGTKHYGTEETSKILTIFTHEFFWATDPEDSSAWTAAKVGGLGGREFGIEVTGGSGIADVFHFNVDLITRSQITETSHWITTVYGAEIVLPSAGFVPKVMIY